MWESDSQQAEVETRDVHSMGEEEPLHLKETQDTGICFPEEVMYSPFLTILRSYWMDPQGFSCFGQDIGLEISSNLNYPVILCDDDIIGGETLTS